MKHSLQRAPDHFVHPGPANGPGVDAAARIFYGTTFHGMHFCGATFRGAKSALMCSLALFAVGGSRSSWWRSRVVLGSGYRPDLWHLLPCSRGRNSGPPDSRRHSS